MAGRKLPKGYQPESGEWMPAGYQGKTVDGGKVARTDRWWSWRWWRGHHFHRADDGQFTRDTLKQFRRDIPGQPRQTSAQQSSRDYKTYLEARREQADRATRGNLLTPQARARGVDPGRWFTGRAGVSTRGQSEELRDWFRENGRNLTASEYRLQHTERRGAARAWYGSNSR